MKTRQHELHADALAFHKANPKVWRLFHQFTMELIGRNFEHYGVSGVWERIRWETASANDPATFKLNNNHRAFYARWWMQINPEYSGFFRTREQTSAHKVAINLPPLTPADFPTWPQRARRIAPDANQHQQHQGRLL